MHSVSRLLALALIFASPQAFGQVTSTESKSKTASQKKSQTGSSSTKSKPSGETKSQTGAKSRPATESQTASKKKSETSAQTGSQAASKTNTEEAAQAGKAKTADQQEREASGQTAQPSPSPSPSPSASPAVEVSSLKPEDLRGFHNNPPEVQELLTAALELTERNLGYLYGSADPERGGMDCSGTIYFLLQKMGVSDVPRSASQQYVWVRKSDAFQPVVSTSMDSFELDALKPGDLLFWTGTYSVDVDPPVTHTMIYLGRARSDGRQLMVGASDGRTFRGAKKYGVSVFDFVIPKPNGKNPMSRFIGYAQIPR
jgi:cell wall-associated NlpC family hydrolase